MADKTQTTDTTLDTPPESVVDSPKVDEPPQWFKDFAEKTEGRMAQFGKDLGRVRGKVKKESEQGPEKTPDKAFGREDMEAIRKLGRIQEGLPDEISADIDALLEDGGSYQEALSMATMAKRILDKAPANGGPNRSPAHPRREAPTKTRPERPRSVKDLLDLQAKARKGDKSAQERYDALMADDDFNPSDLPQYSFQR